MICRKKNNNKKLYDLKRDHLICPRMSSHLKSELQKVWYSNVSDIQIPTVFEFDYELYLPEFYKAIVLPPILAATQNQ